MSAKTEAERLIREGWRPVEDRLERLCGDGVERRTVSPEVFREVLAQDKKDIFSP